jgi:hypothetical protein
LAILQPVAPTVENNEITTLHSGDLVGFDTYQNAPVELVATKSDLTGSLKWTKQYVIAGYNRPVATCIKNTSGGHFLIANLYQAAPASKFVFSVVIKTDLNGNVLWARRLGAGGRNITNQAVEKNGYLYLNMTSDSYQNNQMLLVKIDPNGNVNSECEYVRPITVSVVTLPNVEDLAPYASNQQSFSNLLLSYLPPVTLQLDQISYCETRCGKSVVTTLKNTLEDEVTMAKVTPSFTAKSNLAVNPNPAHNTVTVILPKGLNTRANLVITDITNRAVQQLTIPAGATKLDVPINSLSAGLYQVTLYTNGSRVSSVKLVKQ